MSTVFISSVIGDFEAYRNAARKAVELLGHTPIMSEDFGARAHSSETACITEVQRSDVYVVILGANYGYVTDEGISVTHSEYQAAKSSNRPILAFVHTGHMEPRQLEFKEEVEAYHSGVFRQAFSNPEELKDGVVRALGAWEKSRQAIPVDEFEVRIEQAFDDGARYGRNEPEVRFSYLPQPFLQIDVTKAESDLDVFFQQICEARLSTLRTGYEPDNGPAWTGIRSGSVEFRLYEDGLRTLRASPTSNDGHWGAYFISPEMIRRAATCFYSLLPVSAGFASVGLSGMSQAFVGEPPNDNSMSMRFDGEDGYHTSSFFNPMSQGSYDDWIDLNLNNMERRFGYPPR